MKILDNYEVRDFGNLELLAAQVVEGFIIGLHKSPFHGFSVEFAEHRLYNPGEATRNIDWKVFARSDKLFTKKFEEETNLRCQIVIDISSSMYFPDETISKGKYEHKLAFSALAAASLMNLLKRQRDAFGLTLFDEYVRTHTTCKSSTQHYRLLLSYLDKVLAERQQKKNTGAAAALHEVAENIHRRSLVVIFSDMFDSAQNQEELFSALQHLKYNRHEVVLFHVVDKSRELDFSFDNRPTVFEDMETGERVRLQPNQVREFYTTQMNDYLANLKQRCLQYKIDFVEADVQGGFRPVLERYLVRRTKMYI